MICYIALGSNLGDSVKTLQSAFTALSIHSDLSLLHRSSLYGSKPHGPQDQPDYLNAVAKMDTSLKPLELLDELQRIENAHNRTRTGQRWGARTLDLDLLLYGDEEINSERLTVPHPRMTERSFVLYPLDEVSNELIFPNEKRLTDYLAMIKNDLWVVDE